MKIGRNNLKELLNKMLFTFFFLSCVRVVYYSFKHAQELSGPVFIHYQKSTYFPYVSCKARKLYCKSQRVIMT
jgi:hypothetical protein